MISGLGINECCMDLRYYYRLIYIVDIRMNGNFNALIFQGLESNNGNVLNAFRINGELDVYGSVCC